MNRVRVFLVTLTVFFLLPVSVFSQPEAEVPSGAAPPAGDYFGDEVVIEYSSSFHIEYHANYKVVRISRPWPGAKAGFTYLLVQRGTDAPQGIKADKIIQIPVNSIVTMSTSYLPCLEELGLLDTLVGHDAFAWVTSEAVNERIRSGKITEVGSGQTVNVELLLDMEPDLIMAYGMGNEWDTHPKLEEAKLPYVMNAEWNETTPLGRAEWIKYVAVFFNKEAEANAYFDRVAAEYTALSAKARAVADKPSVFAGAPYQGTWWMSGGGSFAARYYEDAGASYVWADDDSTGSLMLDLETVYEEAGDADFWVNTGYWNSLDDARAADERFVQFKAYKTGMIFNNNKRMGPGGGNDYYESGPIKPHLVLADLIRIFHPAILPGHELYYYTKLD